MPIKKLISRQENPNILSASKCWWGRQTLSTEEFLTNEIRRVDSQILRIIYNSILLPPTFVLLQNTWAGDCLKEYSGQDFICFAPFFRTDECRIWRARALFVLRVNYARSTGDARISYVRLPCDGKPSPYTNYRESPV